MCVVLDTNIWDGHTMLRSHLSASLIHLIERHGGTLGLPAVVAREVEEHLAAAYRKALKSVSSGLGRVRMIHGHSPILELPEEMAEGAFEERLAELYGLLLRLECPPEHFAEAGEMVLSKSPPNTQDSQQFKDCLLWLAVRDLSLDHDVLLVTADGGFYATAGSDDLHPLLEATTHGSVRLQRTMESAVAVLQESAPSLDLESVMEAIDLALRPDINERAADLKLTVEGVNHWEADTFVTGRVGETLVVFEMTHDLSEADRLARTITTGEAIVRAGSPPALQLDSLAVEIRGDEGFERTGATQFMRAAFGGRKQTHVLRVPAPGT